MPRLGFAWDPTGAGMWSVRASYGLFYDQFQNGAGTASQVPVSSIPWAQFNQFSGDGLNFQNPYPGHAYPAPNTFVRPSTVFTIDTAAKPPYAQNWNVGVAALAVRQVPARGPLRRRRRAILPRNIEAEPGGVRSRRDGAERRPASPLRQLPGRRRHLRFLDHRDAAYIARLELPGRPGQHLAAVSRRRRRSTCRTGSRNRSTSCRP